MKSNHKQLVEIEKLFVKLDAVYEYNISNWRSPISPRDQRIVKLDWESQVAIAFESLTLKNLRALN